ncbi:MAG: hypothetical protein N4A47_03865 [Clostridia bacterium]|jgi:hypothetical protein|nr:hypothetical protein [Clostridia bacterium]
MNWNGSSAPIYTQLEILRDPKLVEAYSKGEAAMRLSDTSFQRRYSDDHPSNAGKTIIHGYGLGAMTFDVEEGPENKSSLGGAQIPLDKAIEIRRFLEEKPSDVELFDVKNYEEAIQKVDNVEVSFRTETLNIAMG